MESSFIILDEEIDIDVVKDFFEQDSLKCASRGTNKTPVNTENATV